MYRSPNGSMHKARNLQYALSAVPLEDNEWIVHLDEETVLTLNSVERFGVLKKQF